MRHSFFFCIMCSDAILVSKMNSNQLSSWSVFKPFTVPVINWWSLQFCLRDVLRTWWKYTGNIFWCHLLSADRCHPCEYTNRSGESIKTNYSENGNKSVDLISNCLCHCFSFFIPENYFHKKSIIGRQMCELRPFIATVWNDKGVFKLIQRIYLAAMSFQNVINSSIYPIKDVTEINT